MTDETIQQPAVQQDENHLIAERRGKLAALRTPVSYTHLTLPTNREV